MNLRATLGRLEKLGFRVNQAKARMALEKTTYVGFTI